jgi:RNA-directed DNA polymerase
LGLVLHPEKTGIVHTLEAENKPAGFDFLGFRIQQFRTGRYAQRPFFKGVFTKVSPSAKSIQRVYRSLAKVIDDHLRGPASTTGWQEERVAIIRLNQIIVGWTTYHAHCNAKVAYSKLDNLLWWKVWRTMRRRYKACGREWVFEHRFKDEKGQWRFTVPKEGSNPGGSLRLLRGRINTGNRDSEVSR